MSHDTSVDGADRSEAGKSTAAPFIFCEYCGVRNLDNGYRCTGCGRLLHDDRRPVIKTGNESAAMRMILPVGRSPLAVAAGYLGLISVLIFPAPAALVTGIMAIRDIRQHPERHGIGRAVFGVVMGMFGTAFIIFGLSALIFVAITK